MLHLTSLFLPLSSIVLSTPLLPRTSTPPGNAHLRTIYSFPNETWVENIAVRSDGNLLVTLIAPTPDVWEVDPVAQTARHIYTFPDALSVLGIAEYAPDVFAVNVGNFSTETAVATAGSWSVWSVDMRGCHRDDGWHETHQGGARGAKVKKLTDVPEAAFLNGMAALPENPSTLVIGDCGTGVVYSLDTKTSDYQVAIENVHVLTPAPDPPVIIGINGIQFRPHESDQLYWTNSFRDGHFGRIAIDPHTGSQAGPAEVLFRRKQDGAQDDFTFDAVGDAWLTGSPQDTVVELVKPDWDFEVVVNDANVIAGPTACKFGRTEKDAETLYVVTNGGLPEALPQGIKGGAVVALDTAGL